MKGAEQGELGFKSSNWQVQVRTWVWRAWACESCHRVGNSSTGLDQHLPLSSKSFLGRGCVQLRTTGSVKDVQPLISQSS